MSAEFIHTSLVVMAPWMHIAQLLPFSELNSTKLNEDVKEGPPSFGPFSFSKAAADVGSAPRTAAGRSGQRVDLHIFLLSSEATLGRLGPALHRRRSRRSLARAPGAATRVSRSPYRGGLLFSRGLAREGNAARTGGDPRGSGVGGRGCCCRRRGRADARAASRRTARKCSAGVKRRSAVAAGKARRGGCQENGGASQANGGQGRRGRPQGSIGSCFERDHHRAGHRAGRLPGSRARQLSARRSPSDS